MSGETDTIHSAQSVVESINPPANIDLYTFTAYEGDTVIIQMSETQPSSLWEPQIELYSPSDSSPEVVVSGGDSAILNGHRLARPGQYVIAAREAGGDRALDYSLSLLVIPGPTVSQADMEGGPIVSGETKTGVINPSSDTDAFTFSAEAGDTVIIQISEIMPSTLGTVQVDLFGPGGGQPEASAWGNYSGILEGHQLAESGQYTIVARERGADYYPGYSLSLLVIPGPATSCQDPDGGPILSGQTKSGVLSQRSDTDAFTFTAQAGSSVIIQMSEAIPSSIYEPMITLYGPGGGPPLVSASGEYSASLEGYEITATGQYTIIARDQGADDAFGYSLSLTVLP